MRGKLDANFEDAGEQELKNIARPVRVYQLQAASQPIALTALRLPEKPSIAVLPFQNLSGDGHYYRPLAHQVAIRYRAQFDFHLQGAGRST